MSFYTVEFMHDAEILNYETACLRRSGRPLGSVDSVDLYL